MSSLIVWSPPPRRVLVERAVVEASPFVAASVVCFWVLALLFLAWSLVRFLGRLLSLGLRCFRLGVANVLAASASPFWLLFSLFWRAGAFPSEHVVSAPPSWCLVDRCGQPVGNEVDGVAEARDVPVTAHLCARPRRRAVWVRRLEVVLGPVPSGLVGRLVRGRWTPDLPSSGFSAGLNHVLCHRESGVKIRGGGSVPGREGDNDVRVPYFVVELPDGSMDVVCPELLSALSTYAFLRKREAVLVSALRLRAQEFCKKRGLSESVTWTLVSSGVRWAWEVSARERLDRAALRVDSSEDCWWG